MMCAGGRARISSKQRPNSKLNLVGPRCESVLSVCGVSAQCLLDTGSQVSTVSASFFDQNLAASSPLQKIDQLINIEVAGGHELPYKGFIEVQVRFHKSVTGSSDPIDILLLVVDDTRFNSKVPILLGTNVLKHCFELCKQSMETEHGSFNLKKCKTSRPWKLTYRCLCTHVSNSTHDVSLLNVNVVKINANSELLVECHTDVDFVFSGNQGLVSSDGINLPGGLIVTPMLVEGGSAQGTWQVRVNNPSQVDVIIPRETTLCQLEPVTVMHMSASDSQEQEGQPDVSTLFKLDHLKELGASPAQLDAILEMLNRNIEAVSLHEFDLGQAKGYKHTINLEPGSKPFRMAYRRIPPHMWDEVRDHLQKMLSAGVIEQSSSSYASPIVLVRKKDNSLRFCVDYRKLNSLSIKDAHGLPRPQDIFDRLANAKWFSSLDLKSGYWQLEVDPKDRHLTSFTAGPLGFFQFVKMPFGLCNAGASFQRMMESCMGAENLSSCLLYLDDIVIFSETLDQHIEKLDRVLKRLRECGLKVNAKKCDLFKSKIKYLGHWITGEGISTDEDKVSAVKNWPVPSSREELRRFLGFASFYRRFIHKFAQISEPLHELLRGQKTKKNSKTGTSPSPPPFAWGEAQQHSFENIIQALISTPVLAYADFSKPFELHTDAATSAGLGAVLYQTDDEGRLRVISYASRTLSESERRYPAHKLEFLALKWAVTEKFADYLRGAKFIVKTDNNPLTYVMSTAKLDACGQRWVAELSDYNFDILYRPGKGNIDADALSRIPSQEWKELSAPTVTAVCESQLVSDLVSSFCLSSNSGSLFQVNVDGWWDKHTWQQEQEKDPDILQVLEVLAGERKTADTPTAKQLMRQRKKLFVADQLLQRRSRIDDEEVNQVVVPVALQPEVLRQLHDKMGHFGVDRTLELAKSRFYFPKMHTIVTEYVSSCDRCMRRKAPPQKAPMASLESSGPMDLLCIDFLSLESAKGGYSNILVMTDHFTRYSQAIATKDQTARTTANALISSFINHYGMPTRLHSDQGANFESKTIRQLCDSLGIKKTHTTPYHPQGNAQAERFNATLLSMLACLTEDEKTRWKDHLPFVVHAYNCTRNNATGFSPFQLMFGRKPRLPVDIIKGLAEGKQDMDYKEYVQKVRDSLSSAYERASQQASKLQLRNKAYYDRKAGAASVEVGDRVLVKRVRFKEGPHKLEDRWEEGVYEVVAVPEGKTGVFDVRKEGSPKRKTRRLHRNLLLPIGSITPEVSVSDKSKPRKNARSEEPTDQLQELSSSSDDEEEMVTTSRPTTRSQTAASRSTARASPEVSEASETDTAEEGAGNESETDSAEDEEFLDVQQEARSELNNSVEPVHGQPQGHPAVQQVQPPPAEPNPQGDPVLPNVQPPQAEPTPPAEENRQVGPRRSTRIRRRPAWQRSGEYDMSGLQQARMDILQQILHHLEDL